MKEKIYEFIKQQSKQVDAEMIQFGFNGFDAAIIQKALGCSRDCVQTHTKELVQEHRLIRIAGRPVRYFDMERLTELKQGTIPELDYSDLHSALVYTEEEINRDVDCFASLIGARDSLKQCLEKAKAAMIYPPNGLHTLLHGPTGVGKTMLAEMMFEFASANHILKENARFVVLNCADYADNPQLLTGMLFGYVKGAFTGANEDKEGLVREADGGILFLDEIHRLSVEGQEMLFLLMDKGIYRRIGDSSRVNQAKVLIIGATTANLTESLLDTFKRRIPMIIDIPALSERTIYERYDLIVRFFSIEYNMIKVEMVIEPIVMKSLLSYACNGNVGQLMADIKMICARAYLDYRTQNQKFLHIDREHLGNDVISGYLNWNKNKQENDLAVNTPLIVNEHYNATSFDHIQAGNIYVKINEKFALYSHEYNDPALINKKLKAYMNEYVDKLSKKFQVSSAENKLLNIINSSVYQVVKNAIEYAEIKINRKLSEEVFTAICLHISSLVENASRKTILNKDTIDIASENTTEFMVAKNMKKDIEFQLNISLNDDETFMLTMFLCMDKMRNESKISILVLSHGDGVAYHMVKVANELLKCSNVYSMDMNLNENTLTFIDKVEEKMKAIPHSRGILLMVDMGSLLSFGEILSEKTGIDCRVISMVNTPLLLEAIRKSMNGDLSLQELHTELSDHVPYLAKNISGALKTKLSQKTAIVITCLSGEGTAVKLKKIIQDTLHAVKDFGITLFTCNHDSAAGINFTDYRILAIVGTVNLHMEEVPFISTNEIIMENGLKRLSDLISVYYEQDPGGSEDVPNYMIEMLLKDQLQFLSADKMYKLGYTIYQELVEGLQLPKENITLIPFLTHLSIMAERAVCRTQFDNSLNVELDEIFDLCKRKLRLLEDIFHIQLTDTEISLVGDIFRYYMT